MGIKISGMREVSNKANSFLIGVADQATPRALTEALIVAGNYASLLTPVDTANLINSQYRMPITHTATGYTTGIKYTANYAKNVHDGPQKNWQKQGASNHFLSRGFEDNIAELRQIIINGYKVK
ncbi:MAG: hypothetical protein KTR16_02070 [Acidiferrobacterales bacterium]|nr:hypothetical protein [Acidiferrobacterales bacterium]